MGEIIYEKHFHKETIEEIERERIDFVEAFGEDAEQAPSFDEIMKKIYSNVTYLVLPEREKMAKTFIKTAIEISNDYELDIEIEEHLSHIARAVCGGGSVGHGCDQPGQSGGAVLRAGRRVHGLP